MTYTSKAAATIRWHTALALAEQKEMKGAKFGSSETSRSDVLLENEPTSTVAAFD